MHTTSSSALRFDPQPIGAVARELGIPEGLVETYGRDKAKIDLAALEHPPSGAGRLVLVSALNPTPAGEGKTTVSIGLSMGLRRLGKRSALALREPSLGPVFGVKGGGTGGGRATLVPADDINLHFTGDLHAVTTAHNLLSALVDNACHFGTALGEKGPIDPRQVTWGRAMDMNDRALRNVVVGLGRKVDGLPRQDRFDITAASEVMAVLALASDLPDLERRLGRIVVGASVSGAPVTAEDVGASGAMTALLRDAMKPNLVQTGEGGPALVHAGPFGNIAHGCSSLVATRLALACADYVVTEAGFGFDLGGEKFLDIKCRAAGAWPRLVVLVATLRALKSHGGADAKRVAEPNAGALSAGLEHLGRHLDSAALFGLPALVALNVFPGDTDAELSFVEKAMRGRGVRALRCDAFARGGEGAVDLAAAVSELADSTDAAPPAPAYLYDAAAPIRDKAIAIATKVYGARDVVFSHAAELEANRLEARGFGALPLCMAKTHLSLTDDPAVRGRPHGFVVTIRELRLSAGAGFVVALTGDIMTMPGLPREPAAHRVRLLPNGRIRGLMQSDD